MLLIVILCYYSITFRCVEWFSVVSNFCLLWAVLLWAFPDPSWHPDAIAKVTLEHGPRKGIVGPPNCFLSGCTVLHSYLQFRRGLIEMGWHCCINLQCLPIKMTFVVLPGVYLPFTFSLLKNICTWLLPILLLDGLTFSYWFFCICLKLVLYRLRIL